MTRVFPLPAPARMSTGPAVVSTASRCCGFSWSRNDKTEVAPELDPLILQDNLDLKGAPLLADIARSGDLPSNQINCCGFPTLRDFRRVGFPFCQLKNLWTAGLRLPALSRLEGSVERRSTLRFSASQPLSHVLPPESIWAARPVRVTPVTRTSLPRQEVDAPAQVEL